jgi:hypothetical protein
MGAATSAVLLEISIQNLEYNQILHIFTKDKILNYFMYVDILILYEKMRSNIDNVLFEFNNLRKTLQFMVEKENKLL